MIENPRAGDPVVFFLANGTLDHGLIAGVDDVPDGPLSVVEVEVGGHMRARYKLLGDLYGMDDHDGVIAGLNKLIENCRTAIELTERKKQAGRPVFQPPAPALYQR